MLTKNDIKEELSIKYVQSIAAIKGFSSDIPGRDNDSIDLKISYNGKLSDDSVKHSPELGIQLKATSVKNDNGEYFTFSLPIKNYNDLRADTIVPRIFVLFKLPSEQVDWLSHSTNELIMKKCAYWLNLKDMPEVTNETSKTIHIPITNVLSPEILYDFMIKISKEEDIK